MRLHGDGLAGVLSVGVSNVAEAASSVAFASLPVIAAPDYMIVTVDPLAVAGAFEKWKITAHADGSDDITVERGYEGTTRRAHLAGTVWRHGPVASDVGQVVFRSTSGILQEAIDAAADGLNGGIVPLDPGVHAVAGVVLKDGVELRGSGVGSTTLKLAANTFLLETEGFSALAGTNSTGGVKQAKIRDLAIDGDKVNRSTTVPLVRIYGYDNLIEHVRIRNSDDIGLYSEWSSDPGAAGPDSMEAILRDVVVHNCDGNGVVWEGPHDSMWNDLISYSNVGNNFRIDGNGHGVVATNCHGWGLETDHSWWVAASGARLMNCQAEGSQLANLVVAANDLTWIGGAIFSAIPGDATHVGVQIGIGGTPVAGLTLMTQILNCIDGAIDYENDAGANFIQCLVYQESGPTTIGTRHEATYEHIFGVGATASSLVIPKTSITVDDDQGYKWADGKTIYNDIGGNAVRTNEKVILGDDVDIAGALRIFGGGYLVSATANDSAGAGFRYLIVPNA